MRLLTRPRLARAWKLLPIAFLVLVAALLVSQLRGIEWPQVVQALRTTSGWTLAAAAGLTVLSYALLSCYDLLGRVYTGHGIAPRRVLAIAFVCYAFNLSLGALIGGFAFRYRLYARHGLKPAQTTRVLALSLTTNWLGYLCLAGVLFALGHLALPESWKLGAGALRVLGLGMAALAAAYLLLCLFARRRSWRLRRHTLELPPAPMAMTQAALAIGNWLLVGAIVFLLLGQPLPFHTVFAVLLVSSIAGVLTHVPAGLGVTEVVFVTLLGRQVPAGELIAGLLVFRAVYYLIPLLLGLALYLVLEARARRAKHAG